MKRPERYELVISTLTPLHIGTGKVLLRDYDFVVDKDNTQTYVVDNEKLAAALYDRGHKQRITDSAKVGLGTLYPSQTYDPTDPIFRYVLGGTPQSKTSNTEIQEQIKDVWDRPYIPGSSLKGAIRTALLYVLFRRQKKVFSMEHMTESRAKFAAQGYEHELLVGSKVEWNNYPNYDLLRALHVSDSAPAERDVLRLLNARVWQPNPSASRYGQQEGAPIDLEGVKAGATFRAELTLDTHLLDTQRQALGWSDEQADMLRQFVLVVRNFTDARLKQRRVDPDSELWQKSTNSVAKAIDSSKNTDNEFVLQLGWGGGWSSKTLGDRLQRDQGEFVRLANKYSLSKGRYAGGVFPKSIRLAYNKSGEPAAELGWIKVRVNRIGDGE